MPMINNPRCQEPCVRPIKWDEPLACTEDGYLCEACFKNYSDLEYWKHAFGEGQEEEAEATWREFTETFDLQAPEAWNHWYLRDELNRLFDNIFMEMLPIPGSYPDPPAQRTATDFQAGTVWLRAMREAFTEWYEGELSRAWEHAGRREEEWMVALAHRYPTGMNLVRLEELKDSSFKMKHDLWRPWRR